MFKEIPPGLLINLSGKRRLEGGDPRSLHGRTKIELQGKDLICLFIVSGSPHAVLVRCKDLVCLFIVSGSPHAVLLHCTALESNRDEG